MTPQAHLPVWMELEQAVNVMLTGGSEFFTYKHIYLMRWVGGLHCYCYWLRLKAHEQNTDDRDLDDLRHPDGP